MKTLSKVTIRQPVQRTTQQTLQILTFIHRFRHVTTRHLQLNLGHTTLTTTNNRLALLRAKGYVARQYDIADRAHGRPASYYLTPEGLKLLRSRNPHLKYRLMRSVRQDAVLGEKCRMRFHTLADVYCHFKRHYNGCFSMWTAFDLVDIASMPSEIPDGLVRVTLPGADPKYYFVEIYGWGRTNYQQQQRFNSYISEPLPTSWETADDLNIRDLLVVASGAGSRRRAHAQLRRSLEDYISDDLQICTAYSWELDSDKLVIWHKVMV